MSENITMKTVSDLPVMTETTDNTYAIVEENGEFKRVPGSMLGGGIKTAIIKDGNYDNALASLTTVSAVSVSYECLNMTFEEAYETMAKGEPLAVFGMLTFEGAMTMYGAAVFTGTMFASVPCIVVLFENQGITLFWTADGLSTSQPNGEK